ncbi:hypothetical protein PHJA_000790300 [Phtheirospermum japonicum]|uniref:Uncharacterized protein n=1 Tax=Phtheirospermum japonicum TaxID=374723 RepID=A0A830BRT4_9LAMI|nr:hypothetical protein PHJA_000790300 [Phtheirospermum japonicum]
MATTSSFSLFTPLLDHNKPHKLQLPNSTHRNNFGNSSFLGKTSTDHLQLQTKRGGSKGGVVVWNASPEAAGDLLSSLPLPTIPGFSDNPWLVAFEKIADAVGKVAEEVDKAAEDIGEALPEGGLKKVVAFVEDLAEETVKDAQKVEDLMDKVEEMNDKLEAILEKQSKGTEKK